MAWSSICPLVLIKDMISQDFCGLIIGGRPRSKAR